MDEPQAKKRSRVRGCLLTIVAIPLALGAIGAIVKVIGGDRGAGGRNAVDPVTVAEEARDTRDARTLYAGRAVITATMKEPGSAQFSQSFGRMKNGKRVACGYVNAKNSFGALAGDTQWLFYADSGIGLIRSYTNYDQFRVQWNRYCVGTGNDDLKAAPSKFLGINLGARVPLVLRPYDAAKQVWVFRDTAPRKFLDVAVVEPTYMTDKGSIFGAQATAKGKSAFESLRHNMFAAYGIPTSDGGADKPRTSWDWGHGKMLAQLSYNADHDQTTVSLTRQE